MGVFELLLGLSVRSSDQKEDNLELFEKFAMLRTLMFCKVQENLQESLS